MMHYTGYLSIMNLDFSLNFTVKVDDDLIPDEGSLM